MALSILNRATGIAQSVGLFVLAWWLMAAASGPEAYDRTTQILSHPVAKLMFAGWIFAFVYHLCNGLRHLTWDLGLGLERREARTSGVAVVIATAIITAALYYLAFFARGGAA